MDFVDLTELFPAGLFLWIGKTFLSSETPLTLGFSAEAAKEMTSGSKRAGMIRTTTNPPGKDHRLILMEAINPRPLPDPTLRRCWPVPTRESLTRESGWDLNPVC